MDKKIKIILKKWEKSSLCKGHPDIKLKTQQALSGDDNNLRSLVETLDSSQNQDAKVFLDELNATIEKSLGNETSSENNNDHQDVIVGPGISEDLPMLHEDCKDGVNDYPTPDPETSASATFMQEEYAGVSFTSIPPDKDVPIHPIADMFPMLRENELHDLAENIKSNGLRVPVLICDGQLIDGRNRLEACRRAGIHARAEILSPKTDITNMIVSLNIMRRQMTSSQRAALAVAILPELREKAEERMKSGKTSSENGEAASQAANIFKTNSKYVTQAEKLRETNEELFKDVVSGKINLSAAIKASNKPDTEEPKPPVTSWPVIVEKLLELCRPDNFDSIQSIANEAHGAPSKFLQKWCQDRKTDQQ